MKPYGKDCGRCECLLCGEGPVIKTRERWRTHRECEEALLEAMANEGLSEWFALLPDEDWAKEYERATIEGRY
jgi:hypothetical protein